MVDRLAWLTRREIAAGPDHSCFVVEAWAKHFIWTAPVDWAFAGEGRGVGGLGGSIQG